MSEHYLFTDRPQAASGLEDDSDSAWADFQLLLLAQREQPHTFGGLQPKDLSMDELLSWLERHHHVCPKPEPWFALHALLVKNAREGNPPPPPPPADAMAWRKTSSKAKAICFSDHLRWAERNAALGPVTQLLLGLREDDWHHGDAFRTSAAS